MSVELYYSSDKNEAKCIIPNESYCYYYLSLNRDREDFGFFSCPEGMEIYISLTEKAVTVNHHHENLFFDKGEMVRGYYVINPNEFMLQSIESYRKYMHQKKIHTLKSRYKMPSELQVHEFSSYVNSNIWIDVEFLKVIINNSDYVVGEGWGGNGNPSLEIYTKMDDFIQKVLEKKANGIANLIKVKSGDEMPCW